MADIKITQLGSSAGIHDTDVMVVDDGVSTLKTTAAQIREYASKKSKEEVAENWEENTPYSKNDIRNWQNEIYRCINAHTSSAALTPINTSYWEKTTCGQEIKKLNDAIIITLQKNTAIIKDYPETVAVRIGNVLIITLNFSINDNWTQTSDWVTIMQVTDRSIGTIPQPIHTSLASPQDGNAKPCYIDTSRYIYAKNLERNHRYMGQLVIPL